MTFESRALSGRAIGAGAALLLAAVNAATAGSAAAYHPITPRLADKTVVLSGHDLTVDQVVQVARYGAKVALTPEARQRSADAHALLPEAAAEGATMVGAGNAYYRGVRMPAADALKAAGLEPLRPFGADDSELESTTSYATGQTALLLYDAREALLWADLIYAIP